MAKQPLNQVLERKGPHKSMHCKFCKPPGSPLTQQQSQSHLEKRTKLRLAHQGADLQVYDVFSESGILSVESEACICQLEGEKICMKCAHDENYTPKKKKRCNCPRGARPHPSMIDPSKMDKKKVKRKESDDEFWWEKYEREQAAIVAETWAAWMAQMKEDKKLSDIRLQDSCKYVCKLSRPKWFHILSCIQVLHLEFLSQAIRLDLDENITDRTNFVLSGMGLYPRPKRKILKKCLKFCSYNAVDFLNQLQLLLKEEDQFGERIERKDFPFPKCYQNLYTWNDRIIMTAVCYLEFPQILKEIMDRLPPLPRLPLLPQIPYPEIPKRPKKKYRTPYEEPVWHDRLNWLQKDKIDRLNRCRLNMENKRVKIPHLALLRRPSLIDARPAFLSQIEANERDYFGRGVPEQKRPTKVKPIETFDSDIDVTAVEGIEASEISTTEKADSDDICVFLREQSKPESSEDETKSESYDGKSQSMIESDPEKTLPEIMSAMKRISQREESVTGEDIEIDIPFKTPPKTSSGNTIVDICPVPVNSRAPPPEINYEEARIQLAIINEEVCSFIPRINPTVSCDIEVEDRRSDISERLKKAARKLRKYSIVPEEEPEELSKKSTTSSKKRKKSKKRRKSKTSKKSEKIEEEIEEPLTEDINEPEESPPAKELSQSDKFEDDEFNVPPPSRMDIRESLQTEKEGEMDSEREETISNMEPPKKSKVKRKKKKTKRKRKSIEKTENGKQIIITLHEEEGEYIKQKPEKKNRKTMTESYPGEYDYIYKDNSDKEEEKIPEEPKEANVYTGKINPLLKKIMKDLAEEGYVSAGYEKIIYHPDIQQLIMHLKGEFLDKETREWLWLMTKKHWKVISGPDFYTPTLPNLNISRSKAQNATWAIKKTLQAEAAAKKNLFYFEMAKLRSQSARDFYATLYQKYLGISPRFLNTYYAYLISRYQDSIVKGVIPSF